jgi:hypothetical protein
MTRAALIDSIFSTLSVGIGNHAAACQEFNLHCELFFTTHIPASTSMWIAYQQQADRARYGTTRVASSQDSCNIRLDAGRYATRVSSALNPAAIRT